HAALALNRLHQHRGDTLRTLDDVRAQIRSLRLEKILESVGRAGRRRGARQELVDGVHLAAIGVLALLRLRQPPRDEQVPELLQRAILTPQRFLRRRALLDRKRNVRPIERWKPE